MKNKFYYSFIIILVLNSCYVRHVKGKQFVNKEVDVVSAIDSIVGNLTIRGIDTVMIYKKSCIGCIHQKTIQSYVFWERQNKCYVTKVSNEQDSNDSVFVLGNVFNYYNTFKNEIKEEKNLEDSISLLHYHYRNLTLLVKNKEEFNVLIDNNFYLNNKVDYKLFRLFGLLDGGLLDIELSQMYWQR